MIGLRHRRGPRRTGRRRAWRGSSNRSHSAPSSRADSPAMTSSSTKPAGMVARPARQHPAHHRSWWSPTGNRVARPSPAARCTTSRGAENSPCTSTTRRCSLPADKPKHRKNFKRFTDNTGQWSTTASPGSCNRKTALPRDHQKRLVAAPPRRRGQSTPTDHPGPAPHRHELGYRLATPAARAASTHPPTATLNDGGATSVSTAGSRTPNQRHERLEVPRPKDPLIQHFLSR